MTLRSSPALRAEVADLIHAGQEARENPTLTAEKALAAVDRHLASPVEPVPPAVRYL